MGLKREDKIKGGNEVARIYGSKYMSKIGKAGRKKQLQKNASNKK